MPFRIRYDGVIVSMSLMRSPKPAPTSPYTLFVVSRAAGVDGNDADEVVRLVRYRCRRLLCTNGTISTDPDTPMLRPSEIPNDDRTDLLLLNELLGPSS